ncbi:MAG: alpha/beta hydrolase [bacterium]|nr:alpha/beta hydrolase [bacterium]
MSKLPELPYRPHDFYRIESRYIEFKPAADYPRPVKVHYKVAGEGRPLILVHGLMTSAYSFRYVISPLAKSFRVYVPDLIGAGLSAKPDDFNYSIRRIGEFISNFLKELKLEKPIVVGNSLGGLYVLSLALDHPEQVDRLVVIHCPGFPMFRLKALAFLLKIDPLVRAYQAFTLRFAHQFVRNSIFYQDKNLLSEEEVKEYGRLFASPEGAVAFTRILKESLDSKASAEIISRLAKMKDEGKKFPFPVLLMFTDKDRLVPAEFGDRFHEIIPGSRLEKFADTSHFIHVERPEETVKLIREFSEINKK